MFANNKVVHEKLFNHHNFGHDGPEAFHGVGINAKMSELQAAMGLAVFPYFKTILKERKAVVDIYNKAFDKSNLQLLKIRDRTEWNYCYYPVIFKNEEQLLKVKKALEKNHINARRYFYPSLDTLPYVDADTCLVSREIASSILCLPLYVGLEKKDIEKIMTIVKTNLC
jgi:dTDP-4-amino-4,6-dideoxygalactose transaminase